MTFVARRALARARGRSGPGKDGKSYYNNFGLWIAPVNRR
jgi:hypothetical protein